MALGSTIYSTGTTAVAVASQNEMVNDFTTKSKSAIGTVGGAVSGATSVILSLS